MITEERVWLGGIHTRCLSVAGSGVPVALLHGFADSADTWRGVLSAFVDATIAASGALILMGNSLGGLRLRARRISRVREHPRCYRR
jgi:pimeloyl-ACP methyl ester carboxylesterase